MTDELMDDVFEGTVAEQGEYEDPTPTLIPEGKYLLRINKAGWAKDKEGKIVNPAKPTFVLEEVEIVDGELAGRKAFFLRILTASFERNGKRVSGFGDFMRALDKDFDWENKPTVAAGFVQTCIENGTPFLARLKWEAFDIDHWNNEDGKNQDRETQKVLGKACRLSGMKNFPLDSKGAPIPEWIGPSGATCDARIVIGQVYRSDKKK